MYNFNGGENSGVEIPNWRNTLIQVSFIGTFSSDSFILNGISLDMFFIRFYSQIYD